NAVWCAGRQEQTSGSREVDGVSDRSAPGARQSPVGHPQQDYDSGWLLNPDLFTANALTESPEHTDCIVDLLDMEATCPLLFHHQHPQPGTHNSDQWHLVGRYVLLGTVAMGLHTLHWPALSPG